MARNAEGRAKLKALQAIVNFRGDDEADQVIEDLRAHLAKLPEPEREEKSGRDRKERGGRNRSE